MTPTEKLRAFIERVKGEHRQGEKCRDGWACLSPDCVVEYPCSALRAVLALEEFLGEISIVKDKWILLMGVLPTEEQRIFANEQDERLESALARAAQKIGGSK